MLKFENNGNDYWYLENNHDLDFSTFEQLEFSDYPLNKNAPIRIRIKSNKENFPPSGRQVDVLEFIINNQEDIIKSIFIFYKKTIFPVFNALVDISEHDIAYDIKQLNTILGIKEIDIPKQKYPNFFFYLIRFSFKYDFEHGINILFKNTTPIDFGDYGYQVVDIYENGLQNKDGSPLNFCINSIHQGEIAYSGDHYFDEQIPHNLNKGSYKIYLYYDRGDFVLNFNNPKNLESFSLKDLLNKRN